MAIQVGSRVRSKLRNRIGVVVRDMGVLTPAHSNAPGSEMHPPEQVWGVEFDYGSLKDTSGCWASDLEEV